MAEYIVLRVEGKKLVVAPEIMAGDVDGAIKISGRQNANNFKGFLLSDLFVEGAYQTAIESLCVLRNQVVCSDKKEYLMTLFEKYLVNKAQIIVEPHILIGTIKSSPQVNLNGLPNVDLASVQLSVKDKYRYVLCASRACGGEIFASFGMEISEARNYLSSKA
ncbi:hypothetical protein [Vibrio mediterranei]|uniref:hypothetical protein n=1 Tax=Vibrio mediterranei TaxID=689 RepID=UPI004068C007